ncbi:FadR/GntR family transcriptional regulator [Chelatococcus composti]|jgi:GntR family transcriptional repressor for pyruvate dehydrogenase complex|uniref:DNA-binding FadR family transcriptional regulator n=1 Tax=Chelatococcus composti TaxID=1743235 RepID=A0A841KB69_9HYPH|nr:FadR/GntR family transcriptional regulator [Chelatococcus composti]MBB6169691.1 DNA-binding FadR family transcriptional regulator [Chelatococcus composti]MBS7735228.1 FadR family transcriptional regulator [Chelatococcus composti]PZN43311.1 MAG: GntR family transcriptional regulator [Pseudomonadota bacterium]GGG37625.1 GntR family transcriptional regulator [Chelatococcus composti]
MTQSHEFLDRAPSLADTLAQKLRQEIAAGRMRPGERLPTEQQISERFGVSRPTVREAIGRLKHDGLVVTRQGAGAFIAEPGAATAFRLDVEDFTNRDEIRNIVELLMAVEATATELAAQRRSEEDLAAIQAQLDAMQAAIDRGEPGVEEDVAFHRAIVDATGNPFFRDLSDFLDRRVRHFIRTARANTARMGGLTQSVQAEHQAIFDMIARADPAGARRAAETHLRNAAERLSLYLAK